MHKEVLILTLTAVDFVSAFKLNSSSSFCLEGSKNSVMEVVGTFGIYLFLAGLVVWILWRYFKTDRLGFLPGPKGIPVFGNTFQRQRFKARLIFHHWAKQYGGVYRLRLPVGDMVVVSDYKYIRECLVNKGGEFADE